MEDDDEVAEALQHALNIAAGDDAQFLLEEGGAFTALLDKAQADAMAALTALIDTAFSDLNKVRERQWEVTRYASLCHYIREIVETAEQSREVMTNEEAQYVREIHSRGEITPEDA